MIVKKRVTCFAVITKDYLFVEKQVFEDFGDCPITRKEGVWIHGQTIKNAWFRDDQLQHPDRKETLRRLRKCKGGGTTATFLNCSSCLNQGDCMDKVYAKRIYTPRIGVGIAV